MFAEDIYSFCSFHTGDDPLINEADDKLKRNCSDELCLHNAIVFYVNQHIEMVQRDPKHRVNSIDENSVSFFRGFGGSKKLTNGINKTASASGKFGSGAGITTIHESTGSLNTAAAGVNNTGMRILCVLVL